jgi:hypothetical protein
MAIPFRRSAYLIAKYGGKMSSAARGHVRPAVKSPFDFTIPIQYKSAAEFFGYLLPINSYSIFFDLHVKCPLKFFGKGYSSVKKFFIVETPKSTISAETAFDALCMEIGSVVWSVGRVTTKKVR